MAKKRIKAFGEWVEDHLRRACGALSPDKRIIVILTLLLFFSVLSLYFLPCLPSTASAREPGNGCRYGISSGWNWN